MPDINLLNTDSSVVTSIKLSTEKWVERIMVGVFVVALLAYGVIFLLNRTNVTKLEATKGEIANYKAEIDSNKNRSELITRQGQLLEVKNLLDKHLYWSKLLPELSRVTLGSASYSGMQISAAGQMNLTVTMGSYSDAEKLLQVFDLPQYNKYFSNVKIMALSRVQKDQQLQTIMRLQLTLNPELLVNKTDEKNP